MKRCFVYVITLFLIYSLIAFTNVCVTIYLSWLLYFVIFITMKTGHDSVVVNYLKLMIEILLTQF